MFGRSLSEPTNFAPFLWHTLSHCLADTVCAFTPTIHRLYIIASIIGILKAL